MASHNGKTEEWLSTECEITQICIVHEKNRCNWDNGFAIACLQPSGNR